MGLKLYDLAAADETVRFSPYCWRTRMALKHKQLNFNTVPWRFTDKSAIAFSKQKYVPVLVDESVVVHDSARIAEYLEQNYPERPQLFAGTISQAQARFIGAWADTAIHPPISRMIVLDIWNRIDPKDRAYFRETREARFGQSLEAVQADRDAAREQLRVALAPMRQTLALQPFLCGATAAYADYAVFGAFQWARVISSYDVLTANDPVFDWRDRMLSLFSGYAASYAAASSHRAQQSA